MTVATYNDVAAARDPKVKARALERLERLQARVDVRTATEDQTVHAADAIARLRALEEKVRSREGRR